MTEHPHSVFSDRLLAFEIAGAGPELPAAAPLAAAFRNLIMARWPEPIPEWISGHAPDGRPSAKPRIALMPLPFVGSERATGRIMGLAIALPRAAPAAAIRCLHNLTGGNADGGDELKLRFTLAGRRSEVTLRPPEPTPGGEARRSLRPETWTRPSEIWHTATPATLDRYYKGSDKARLERENVAEQCRRIGLPAPVAVALGPVSMLEGAPPARDFPRLRRRSDRGGAGEWQHTHAIIVFGEKVRGPVIIGSGRYRGYGLCHPA